jgi:hypothetical protein
MPRILRTSYLSIQNYYLRYCREHLQISGIASHGLKSVIFSSALSHLVWDLSRVEYRREVLMLARSVTLQYGPEISIP